MLYRVHPDSYSMHRVSKTLSYRSPALLVLLGARLLRIHGGVRPRILGILYSEVYCNLWVLVIIVMSSSVMVAAFGGLPCTAPAGVASFCV
jgi:hypothetical protein